MGNFIHTSSNGTIGSCVGPPSDEHPKGCLYINDEDHIMATSVPEMEQKLSQKYGNMPTYRAKPKKKKVSPEMFRNQMAETPLKDMDAAMLTRLIASTNNKFSCQGRLIIGKVENDENS